MARGVVDIRERLGEALRGRSDVWVAVLFGSRARGTEGPGSDVDLAVWAPGVDRLELGHRLSGELGLEVDVVSLVELDIPLLAQVVDHGVRVHEGRRGAYASWWARALSTLELDLPWYAKMRDAWLRRVAAEGL